MLFQLIVRLSLNVFWLLVRTCILDCMVLFDYSVLCKRVILSENEVFLVIRCRMIRCKWWAVRFYLASLYGWINWWEDSERHDCSQWPSTILWDRDDVTR